MNLSMLRLLAVCSLALAACSGQDEFPAHSHEEFSASTSLVAQTCTALNVHQQPVAGTFCGGSSHAFNCTPGAMYKCSTNSASNNCTLISSCANGCTSSSTGADACFSGAPSFALNSTAVPGGTELTATVSLADSHQSGGIVNWRTTRLDLLAGRFSCNVPQLTAAQTTASFPVPTAVVSSQTVADVYTDIAYTDARGVARELISPAISVTLQPGGTPPPAPAVTSFTLSPPNVAAGGVSFMNATLSHVAPANNQQVNVTSSDPSTAAVIAGGQPLIFGGCLTGGGAETIQAAKQVSASSTVTISAQSAGNASAPATQPFTVAVGCSPKTCIDLAMPACTGPDGCGGTLQCGCSFGQVCGGGGPGICGDGAPPSSSSASLSSLALSSASTTAGNSVTGTVTLTGAAPAGGATVALSSSGAAASVPPSVTVAEGSTSTTFAVATSSVSAAATVTIVATLGTSQSSTLTVNPATAPATSNLTVAATGRSGVTITSSPAGISAAVGTSKSAQFTTGSTVTLTASSGRTVVWSGACASTRDVNSCTFKISGDSSVTANVK
jgi:hypothetical protein